MMFDKCQECAKEGIDETLYHGSESTTLMSVEKFTDIEGNKHIHDDNIHTTIYWCKNGHFYIEKIVKWCPSCSEHLIKYEVDTDSRSFLHRANNYLQCPNIYGKLVDLPSLQQAVDIIRKKEEELLDVY